MALKHLDRNSAWVLLFAVGAGTVACGATKADGRLQQPRDAASGQVSPRLDASPDATRASEARPDARPSDGPPPDTRVSDAQASDSSRPPLVSPDAGQRPDAAPADPGVEGDGDFTVGRGANGNFPVQKELTDLGAPKGKAFTFSMSSTASAIFRGDDTTLNPQNRHSFTRRIDVYVPAQYKDGTPAPVLILQDGPGDLGLVRNALDNLTIASDPARRLPPFVAIAVANGGGDGPGSERGLEYDTMSDRYAQFVETEVLPAVLANGAIKAAYPNLQFTTDPDGRATEGCSSGAAAALIMAWFRPELFRRVITYSGTFVDQQDTDAPEQALYPLGAWEFHSGTEKLIETSPVEPLRVFLNANQNDNGATLPESSHHNWLMANQRTAAELQDRGYHHRYVYGEAAGHCEAGVRTATLADTLVWAWRGYSAAP